MTKEKFFGDLESGLRGISQDEKDEAIEYYKEYFADSPQSDEETMKKLGNPNQIARQITAQAKVNQADVLEQSPKKSMSAFAAVILAIFAIPIGVPILIALAAVVISIFIAIFAIIFSLFVAGGACILSGIIFFVCSFFFMFIHLPTGIAALGSAIVAIGVGMIIILGTYFINKFFVGGLISLAKKITRRNEDEEQK